MPLPLPLPFPMSLSAAAPPPLVATVIILLVVVSSVLLMPCCWRHIPRHHHHWGPTPRRLMPTQGSPWRPTPSLLLGSLRQVTLQAWMLKSPRRQWLRLGPLWSLLWRPRLILVPQLDILPTSMVIHNSTTIIKRNMLLFYRNCWAISNDFPVSPDIQMERSLLILIPILRHRGPVRLLAIKNVNEITGIMHLNINAAQYLTRMKKHRASPLNKSW